MDSANWMSVAEAWASDALIWIGYGTIIGLLARLVMPGRDPVGAVMTLAMGIGGVVFGCGAYALVLEEKIHPLSPAGLVVATAGAFTILLFHRLIAGKVTRVTLPPSPRRRYVRRPRRTYLAE